MAVNPAASAGQRAGTVNLLIRRMEETAMAPPPDAVARAEVITVTASPAGAAASDCLVKSTSKAAEVEGRPFLLKWGRIFSSARSVRVRSGFSLSFTLYA